MPWDKDNYPDSLKNFMAPVRNKAVEIANALLEDGYEEGGPSLLPLHKPRSGARIAISRSAKGSLTALPGLRW